MNLKEVKKYVSDTIEGYFKPKVLKKFDEDTNGNLTYDGDLISANTKVSGKLDNAIEVISDTATPANDGLYVKDISEEVKKINIAQKTVNELGIDELLSNKVTFTGTASSSAKGVRTSVSKDITLLKSVENYMYIDIYMEPDSTSRNRIPQCTRIKVNDIIYNNSNNEVANNGSLFTIMYNFDNSDYQIGSASHNVAKAWFKDNKTIYIKDITISVDTKYSITSIQGIKKETITIDPINYLDTKQGIQDTPVGHIMSIMGNNAPEHYLKCDGTIYNKDDYPHLWEYFKKEFGTPNKFGGNGTTTFAVPDLKGEFLRGTGTNSHTNQGNGDDVGEHQDGTEMPFVYTWGSTLGMLVSSNKSNDFNGNPTKFDSSVKAEIGYQQDTANFTTQTSVNPATFTTRPTNTSVLYVIKYEPTYFVGSINGKEEIDELLDTPYLVNTVGDSRVDLPLSKSIEDYDYLEIEHCLPYDTWDLCNRTDRIKVSDITYNTSTINQAPNPIFKDSWTLINVELNNFTTSLEIGFRNATTLYIYRHVFNKTISTTAFRGTKIKAVRGIKTIYAPDKAIGGGTGTVEPEPTDAEIQTAITETITELNK